MFAHPKMVETNLRNHAMGMWSVDIWPTGVDCTAMDNRAAHLSLHGNLTSMGGRVLNAYSAVAARPNEMNPVYHDLHNV